MRSWPAFIAFLLFIFIWSLVVELGFIASYLLPAPQQVLASFQEIPKDYWMAFQSTLVSTLIGFSLSALIGFGLALLFVSFDFLKRAFLPFAIFFQTVPVVAIAPLLVIWFGFGEPTVRASAFIVSLFPVLASSLVGLGNMDPGLQELFQAYQASKLRRLISLQIPGSLAMVFSGLQVSAGLAVIGALVGEFVAGGGLGGLIDSARTQQRVDIVFAALLLSSFLGVLFTSSLRALSKIVLRWRPYFPKDIL